MVTELNKSLLPIVQEDDNFKESSPSLFGTEFARKSKDLVDQVKAMRSSLIFRRDRPPKFFRSGPPAGRGVTTRTETAEAEPQADLQASGANTPHSARRETKGLQATNFKQKLANIP